MGFRILEFGTLILGFWAWDLKIGNLCLEFCSFGIRVWDSVLGFGVRCLGFGILVFWISSFGFWVLDLDFGDQESEFWRVCMQVVVFWFGIWTLSLGFGFRSLKFLIFQFDNSGLGFWFWDLEFGVCGLEFWSLGF